MVLIQLKNINKVLKSKHSPIALLLLFSSFLPITIWPYKERIIDQSIDSNSQILSFFSNFLNSFSKVDSLNITHLIGILFVFIPYLAITLFELSMFKGGFKKRFRFTSISGLFSNYEYKFSDIWYFIFSKLISLIPSLTIFLTLGISTLNTKLSLKFGIFFDSIFGEKISILNGLIIFIIALLAMDLRFYISHWMKHNISFFWDSHELHHSATQMTLFNEKRGTFYDNLFIQPFLIPIDAFTGLALGSYLSKGNFLPLLVYSIYITLRAFINTISHSNTYCIFPKPFSLIFMSPSLHWLHHSNNPNHFNTNLGSVFSIWDRVFGTYLSEKHIKDISGFGIDNSEYNKFNPLYCFIVLPLIRISRRMRKVYKQKDFRYLISLF